MAIQVKKPERNLMLGEPLREMEDLERRFVNLFGQPLFPAWRRWLPWGGTWMPAIDVVDKNSTFMIKAELPGMKLDDIEITIEDRTLTIKGERKTEREVKEEEYYRSEGTYGRFLRSITLPSSVDASKIEASYENGILEVTVPKTVEKEPKKIRVAVKKGP